MENFILYEELGAGSRTVVYKGRKKGHLNYVAIVCAEKAKKPEITNHVRLSQDLDHPNVACFYEWYETSNHLWLVVELCTGGSLESIIGHDGCLSEDVVRRFGWDLVKGLKYIHELGIIFSELTPAKIFLDGSGALKFGNFCLSKADGETLEDFFTSRSTAEEEENSDNTQKRLNGPPTYKAPEVLKGSETNMRSDLWALGCTLYYMFTGKPPFCSESSTEITDQILHQEPPPPRQTVLSACPPSEDFLNLLQRLLNKNPDKRMDWPELLGHSFWTQVLMEEAAAAEEVKEDEGGDQEETKSCEGVIKASLRHTRIPDPFPAGPAEKLSTAQPPSRIPKILSAQTTHKLADGQTDTRCQQAARHTASGALRNYHSDREMGKERGGGGEEEAKTEEDPKLTGAKQMSHTLQPNKALTLDHVSALRPKSGVDEDNTEAIFLLSSCSTSRRSCSITDSLNQTQAPQVETAADITSSVKALLHTDSDLIVTPIMDNPKILKSPPVRFDPKTLCVPPYSVEKLRSLSDEEWTVFLSQLCSSLEEQSPSTTLPPPPPLPPHSTANRSRLNLLCYLCCVVGHEAVANRLLNSTLLPVLNQQLRTAPNWEVRSKLLRVMGLLALHCTELGEDSPVSEGLNPAVPGRTRRGQYTPAYLQKV